LPFFREVMDDENSKAVNWIQDSFRASLNDANNLSLIRKRPISHLSPRLSRRSSSGLSLRPRLLPEVTVQADGRCRVGPRCVTIDRQKKACLKMQPFLSIASSFSWRLRMNQMALAETKIKISIILKALAKFG
jgi:hypothetical protein